MRTNSKDTSILKYPSIVSQILSYMDDNFMSTGYQISKLFGDLCSLEIKKRQLIVHTHIIDTNGAKEGDLSYLFNSFIQLSRKELMVNPKELLVLVGGHRKAADYRQKSNSLIKLTQTLPKDCRVIYLHTDYPMISNRGHNTVRNYSTEWENTTPDEDKLKLPSMWCFLVPKTANGIQINSYISILEVPTDGVKAVIYVVSNKILNKRSVSSQLKHQLIEEVRQLWVRLGNNVAIAGGVVIAAKQWTTGTNGRSAEALSKGGINETHVCDKLIITLSGQRVRTASVILNGRCPILAIELKDFKSALGFDVDNTKDGTTFAIFFCCKYLANKRFFDIYKLIFPLVPLYAFKTSRLQFGKQFLANPVTQTQTQQNSRFNDYFKRYSGTLLFINITH
ncbi:uncharacterized protein LOC128962302 [Oppia nitens]|uniref:uncharacterized protein LOC128962302 n=1 Tax=Oppia nitens TaxID=1686743 RepID=UPI0023DB9B86|nr:uncharacterized protein LOC128962302 [Oppia nitens]XP_054164650.1 uncharacterized protein LOC128962302 [Oppia nitens]